ncbi:MAG TPA: type IV toxin-antitoxin system AbiEi family antitoxin domain-containing protein [Beutenbergiaceae bacterium]|nr:type IV toxin-antitoxin system AbiEi family antitoxin domain-containing protein [Beutenbergiaceae bacterium]
MTNERSRDTADPLARGRTRARITALLLKQDGVISRQQALAAGLTATQVDYRLRLGEWERIRRGVFRLASTPYTRTTVGQAILRVAPVGAALSHFSAARIHGLDVRPGSPLVWLTIPHAHKLRGMPGARIIRSRNLSNFTTGIQGKPVTTVARTIIDLSSFLTARAVQAVIYDAIRTKRTSPAELEEAAAAMPKSSRAAQVRRMLAELEEGFDSGLEAEADEVFRANGLHFLRQHRVRMNNRIIRRFDFAEPALKLGIEIDGRAFHTSAEAQRRDRDRDRRAATLGWQTLRFTTADVREHPQQMIATIREVMARRVAEGVLHDRAAGR